MFTELGVKTRTEYCNGSAIAAYQRQHDRPRRDVAGLKRHALHRAIYEVAVASAEHIVQQHPIATLGRLARPLVQRLHRDAAGRLEELGLVGVLNACQARRAPIPSAT